MINLKQNTLIREIPDNLLIDPKVASLAKSLQNSLDKMFNWAEKINYTMNLEQLDDAILEHLLWEKHITWSEGLGLATTREQKINLIDNAIELHRIKGTTAAIELVFKLVDISCKLEEWFEYGGEPYHFRLSLRVTDKGLNEDTLKLVEMLIMEYKNVRSLLEALNIYYTSLSKTYIGVATLASEKITVYPFAITNLDSAATVKTVLATHSAHEKITVYPKGGN